MKVDIMPRAMDPGQTLHILFTLFTHDLLSLPINTSHSYRLLPAKVILLSFNAISSDLSLLPIITSSNHLAHQIIISVGPYISSDSHFVQSPFRTIPFRPIPRANPIFAQS